MQTNTGKILTIIVLILSLTNTNTLTAQYFSTANTTSGLPSSNVFGIDVADLENDGDQDVLVTTLEGSGSTIHTKVNIYTNNGSGTFTLLSGTAFGSVQYAAYDSKFIDIDGDNDQDVLIISNSFPTNPSVVTTELYRNDGGNTFTKMIGFPALDIDGRVAIGDLDNDNDKDLIIVGRQTTGSDYYSPFINDGSGNFSYTTNPTAPAFGNGSHKQPVIAELSGGGSIDVLAINIANNNLSLYGSVADAANSQPAPFGICAYSDNFAVADIDGDGDNDVIADYNSSSGSIKTTIFTNNGSGAFTSGQVLAGLEQGILTTGDVDNDGDIDIYRRAGNVGTYEGGLYINDGTGTFTLDVSFIGPNINGDGYLIDLNGDNKLDLLVSSDLTGSGGLHYYENVYTTKAVDFDGTNIYTATHQAALNILPMTIEFKVNAGDGYSPGIMDKWSGTNGFDIMLVAGLLRITYQSDASNTLFLNSGFDVGAIGWKHVAIVFESSGMKVYVDGLLKNTATWTGTPTAISNTANLRLGRNSATSTFYSDNLDEVRIWNTARTQAEIVANMCGTISSPASQANLVAYYSMDTDLGTNLIYDRSSNENNLTISGGSRANTTEQTGCTAPNLPVELIAFTGRLTGNQVQLDWSTASEDNNDGFEIQRTVGSSQLAVGNGQLAENTSWETIGFVQGNGTTNDISEYQFVDNQPKEGNNYYRLKQIDYDGNYEYSNIIQLATRNPQLATRIFPNPANNNINIETDTPTVIQITNLNGQVLKEQSISGNTTIATSDLANGIYFIKVGSSTQKLIVQHF
jgi:hypothetical protein